MRTGFKLRRPSAAFVIASLALFAVLGGTGYSATQAHSFTRALTQAKVQAIVKKYVNSHPATVPLNRSISVIGAATKTVGTAGPWKLKLTCSTLNDPAAAVTISGPGAFQGQALLAPTNSDSAGEAYQNAGVFPNSAAVNPGYQISQELFLKHGSTSYEVTYNLQASTNGATNVCSVLGDATKIG